MASANALKILEAGLSRPALFNMQTFTLNHFDQTDTSMRGHLVRYDQALSLSYVVEDENHRLLLDDQVPEPKRVTGLWQESCFEIFLKNAQTGEYLEYNFSPRGDWDCFYFDGQVRPPSPKPYPSAPVPQLVHSHKRRTPWRLDIQFELPSMLTWVQQIGQVQVGLSAVLKNTEGELHYFALVHPEAKPNFHHPENFQLLI